MSIKMNGKRVILALWVTYSASYLIRKPLSLIKADLAGVGVTKRELMFLDLAFLVPYALVQLVFGDLLDAVDAHRVFFISGLLAGTAGIFGTYSAVGMMGMYTVLFSAGACLSITWPAACKIVADSLASAPGASSLNDLFGFLATSPFVGGFFATFFAVQVHGMYGWESVLPLSSVVFCVICFVMFWVTPTPSYQASKRPPKSSFWHALNIPCVQSVLCANVCTKMVRYAIYMWLPMYLQDNLSLSLWTAGILSTAFEVGGAIGSWSVAKLASRSPLKTCTLSCVVSLFALLLFCLFADRNFVALSGVLIGVVGASVCGVDMLLGGAVACQLAGKNSKGAVVGLINGLSCLGVIGQGPLVHFLCANFGWVGFHGFLVGISLATPVYLYYAQAEFERVYGGRKPGSE